eukprot:CAMPEP_0185757508 /NCGR_PEP_ID=MMETSP1174-20130828/15980_1 /TAXON_ID=35687 /ORGANISM="Dictyocha speculum, Strain CCMP1381" /LENGTH=87 /DNA_ID=CAMNT_0028436929 /DNA_START=245 /DNA_END=505 /DNA_ORIENTATION=-
MDVYYQTEYLLLIPDPLEQSWDKGAERCRQTSNGQRRLLSLMWGRGGTREAPRLRDPSIVLRKLGSVAGERKGEGRFVGGDMVPPPC